MSTHGMQKMISLRLSAALLERLDALVEVLKQDPTFAPRGTLTRAEVLRSALMKGCDQLEQHAGTAQGSATAHQAGAVPHMQQPTGSYPAYGGFGMDTGMLPALLAAPGDAGPSGDARRSGPQDKTDEQDKEFEPF